MRFYDATNPEARRYIWEKVTDGYRRYGIRAFWLDACEPEMRPRTPRTPCTTSARGSRCRASTPASTPAASPKGCGRRARTTCCCSAGRLGPGSQRYGAAVWSGDIDSTFEALAAQIPAGLNIGISGIPWWTTDIGGFKGGDPNSPYFRELVVRWFQFGVFCPLFRLHGVREPGPLVGSGRPGRPTRSGRSATRRTGSSASSSCCASGCAPT